MSNTDNNLLNSTSEEQIEEVVAFPELEIATTELDSDPLDTEDEIDQELEESLDREAEEIMASIASSLLEDSSTEDDSPSSEVPILQATSQPEDVDSLVAGELPELPTDQPDSWQIAEPEGLDSELDHASMWTTPDTYATTEEEKRLQQLAEEPIPYEPQLVTPQAPAPKEPKRRFSFATLFMVLLVLLVAAYMAGVIGFMNYFMPKTTLNGTDDVSLKSIKEVAEEHSATISGFGLTVQGDGIDLSIGASDINARYDGKAYARTAMSQQNPWIWPLELTRSRNFDVETTLTYDAARLEDIVGSAVDAFNKDAKKPVDAEVTYNKETKRYEIKKEEMGEAIDKNQVLALVRSSVGVGQQSVELGEDLLIKPSVYSDDEKLTEPVKKVNASLEATQDIVMGDKTLATLSEEDIAKWITVSDDLKVTFDEDACTAWCRGELSEQIDTIGSKRSFKTPDGRDLTVSGGTYGWSLNGTEVASQIAKNVRDGEKGTIEATWLVQAKTWNPGGNDWGDTYVEIDLTNQYVKYFKDGKVVWETSCVSGGPNIDNKDRRTPNGIYYINDNMRSGHIELKGEIDPKTNEPSYISYVDYWMPFIGDSVALHDADWRNSFGGDIYMTNGSHGCVNLPPDKAKELYGMVGVGTVVVVHG